MGRNGLGRGSNQSSNREFEAVVGQGRTLDFPPKHKEGHLPAGAAEELRVASDRKQMQQLSNNPQRFRQFPKVPILPLAKVGRQSPTFHEAATERLQEEGQYSHRVLNNQPQLSSTSRFPAAKQSQFTYLAGVKSKPVENVGSDHHTISDGAGKQVAGGFLQTEEDATFTSDDEGSSVPEHHSDKHQQPVGSVKLSGRNKQTIKTKDTAKRRIKIQEVPRRRPPTICLTDRSQYQHPPDTTPSTGQVKHVISPPQTQTESTSIPSLAKQLQTVSSQTIRPPGAAPRTAMKINKSLLLASGNLKKQQPQQNIAMGQGVIAAR